MVLKSGLFVSQRQRKCSFCGKVIKRLQRYFRVFPLDFSNEFMPGEYCNSVCAARRTAHTRMAIPHVRAEKHATKRDIERRKVGIKQ